MLINKIIFYSVFLTILHYISSLPKHCNGHMTPKPTAFNTTDIKPCWVPCIKLSFDLKYSH